MGRHLAMFNDFSGADNYLGGKDRRPIPSVRATDVHRIDADTIALRYQATDVVTYHADGRIVLNSGGWLTPTTKQRINDFSPANIYQQKGAWYFGGSAARLEFQDGIAVSRDGLPVNLPAAAEDGSADRRKIDRQVRDYIKGFAAAAERGDIGDPSGGDCWGCYMSKAGETPGPAPRAEGSFRNGSMPSPHGRTEALGIGHYLEHFAEGYFVPSLLFNAIRCAGYREPGLIWHLCTKQDRPKDRADWTARVLRGYFRRMKPALYAAVRS